MPVILGPDGPKFIPTVARATTDKDAPGAALGVQLTQGTSLPRGRAMAVSAEVEGGDGTSLPQGNRRVQAHAHAHVHVHVRVCLEAPLPRCGSCPT